MRLDIVMPAYNEADRIGPTLAAYRRRYGSPGTRFLVALDGCTDATAEVVHAQHQDDPRVQLFEYPKLGKGGALAETFRRTDAELVGFVDADGATPPAEFQRLVDAAGHRDGAIASRRHHASILPAPRPLSRRVASAGFASLVQGLFRLPYADTQCGAKVFRRHVVERVVPLLSSRGFLFDVDLLYVASRLGFDIVEVPTVWIERDGSKLMLSTEARRMGLAAMALWLGRLATPVPTAGQQPVVATSEEVARAA